VSDHPFYRLAPFIQEYIYRNQWTELRNIQVEASNVIFDTDAHLILAAGTASGKTEAALLPILTLLHEHPAASVGILYIGPTKALINDQFYRLEGLLEEAHIPVWAWHGDVATSKKRRLLQRPQGVLQITPESLESLLINRITALTRLFSDLHFVIIDEIHVFMNADRGRQVLCQLQRLEAFMRDPPRRVGLSATLGDYRLAETWLQAGTKRDVITVSGSGGGRLRLAMEHFFRGSEEQERQAPDAYEQYIFDRARERTKTLIFTNRRGKAEETIAALRAIARRKNLPDIYHVHHGSISAPLREEAERMMNAPHQPAVTAATLTLELGIDIGQLERIIQLGAPFSVSSFLQRLGRSGRRGNPSEMWFVFEEDIPSGKETLPDQIPWFLLQAIAIIQLYLEEKWIEPIRAITHPFSLLYHQTMSTLAGMGELSPPALAQRVLTLAPFQHITPDDYRILLQHLIEIDHLEQLETGGLIIGLEGEKIVNNYRFYAVFEDNDEYTVLSQSGEIGRIISPPPVGFRFALAGRTWEVINVNHKQRSLFVKRVSGRSKTAWMGGGGEIHTRVLRRMRQVLLEKDQYRYLQSGALERLEAARQLAKMVGINRKQIIPLGNDLLCFFPWAGTLSFNTLLRYLKYGIPNRMQISAVTAMTPFYIKLYCPEGEDSLRDELLALQQQKLEAVVLLDESEAPEVKKFDRFIPDGLKRKAFANDHLDINALKTILLVQNT
jgi:ATP-dependent Lhr-like helicase